MRQRTLARLVITLLLLSGLALCALSLVAGVAGSEAPVARPAATAADWQAAHDQAARAGLQQAEAAGAVPPAGGWSWAAIGASLLAGLGVAVPLAAKVLAGTNPVARLVTAGASLVWNAVAHRDHREADQLGAALLDALPQIVASLDTEAGDELRGLLLTALPPALRPAAAELLDRHAALTRKPPPA